MQKVRVALLLPMAMMCLWLSGCGGSGHPSESAGRKVFENQRKNAIERGLLQIQSFHQINGQMRDAQGVKVYGMQYEAEVKHLNPYSNGLSGRPSEEIKKEQGVLTFEQTEKGWRAADGEVY